MDASVLERSISEFSKSLSWLNGWLVAMTAVVVLGLFIEYIPELRDEWKNFIEAGAWKSLIERHSGAWKPLAILLGAVMVTGGVAGEMVFEALSFHKEGQLEQAHADLDNFLQGKTESAETAANGAVGDFNKAQQQLGILTNQVGQLDRQLDAARLGLSKANAQLAGVRARTFEARECADSIAASVNPRMLDRKRFLSILAGKPKGTAEIWCEPDDKEASMYAQQIHDFLGPEGAGWGVTPIQALSRKLLPESYNEQTPLLDRLRILASAERGIAIAGGRFLSPPERPSENLWILLQQAVAAIEGVKIIQWGGQQFEIPMAPDNHFVIVVGHHRIEALRWGPLQEETKTK